MKDYNGEEILVVKRELFDELGSFQGVNSEVDHYLPSLLDTANNPTKPATLETGKVIQVPLFVKPGDKLKINTTDGSYSGRA